jgi:tetratricopeptide (TPR) repeat protein
LRHALDDRDWRVRLRALDGIDAGTSGALRLALFKRALVDADGGVRAKAGLLYAHAAPHDVDDDAAPVVVAADLAASADLAPAPSDLAPSVDLSPPAVVADLAPPAGAERARAEDAREEAQLAMTSAEIALEAGRYDAAVSGLQKAHKLDPRLRIYFSLGEAYRKQGDNERDVNRQRAAYAKAIAAYAKANDPRAKSYAAELQERVK